LSLPAHDTYDPVYFQRLAAIDQRHAWFRARNELIGDVAAAVSRDLPPGFRVLEVGCGAGAVLQRLEAACPRGQVIGMDPSLDGLRLARRRCGCPLVLGDANYPPFGATFDIVGLFDVLEHLPDDVGILTRMRGLLRPGGSLLLTVPADPSLWSAFDEASRHVRRYRLPELEEKLRATGFEVTYITHFMQILAPMLRVWRRLGARRERPGEESELRIIPIVNELLYRAFKAEQSAIRKRRQISSGTSLLALARRDADRHH
jgi:SAM-dependent methyltransferase